MKKYLYIPLLICLLSNIKAQEEPTQPRIRLEQSIGVNTASVLRKILRVTPDSATNNNNYLLMYKLRFGKNGVRLSGLANFSSEKEQIAGFLDSKVIKNANYAARIGYERQSNAGKHFLFSYGIDAVWEYRENSSISDSGFDKVSIISSQYGFGGGPFLGITWQLSKRLSLYSEAAIYYTISKKSRVVDFEKNPDFNDIKTGSSFDKISYLVPTGLFLQYHF